MSPRAGLSTAAVVRAALALIDEAGPDALSLTRLAERTGVATPSLYKHVNGMPGLRRELSLRLLHEFTTAMRTATEGRTGDDAVRAVCLAYRQHLLAHPNRLPFMAPAPDASDPEVGAAAAQAVQVAYDVLAAYGLTGSAAVHATRCVRAAVHGFVALEVAGGFGLPEDVDRTFDLLVNMIISGLPTMAEAET